MMTDLRAVDAALSQGDFQLKVKFYLEGFPEPQILLFDPGEASHRENVAWVAQDKLFAKEYAPSATVDVETDLIDRAKRRVDTWFLRFGCPGARRASG